MKIYIRSAAAISPQKTFGADLFLDEPVNYTGNRLQTLEPDYTKLIDVKLLRRMSRIIKMGVAAASACLQQAGETNPGAIVTGTAYGCLDDTGIFLTQLVQRNEESPPPTAFIQSTHNTVGAQIALMLKCHNYNNTFVHGGFSFESALLDAMLLLKDKEADTVLVGSADELTGISFSILQRFGLYKQEINSTLDLYKNQSRGTIAGEGTAFFLLANEPSPETCAQLDGMDTFYKPKDITATAAQISNFLAKQAIDIEEIDLLINGRNGDTGDDSVYDQLEQSVLKNKPSIHYKHLCGEYPTSVSFAFWLATRILKTGNVPAVCGKASGKKIKTILIYNHYQNRHHSLLLLSAC